MVWSRTLCVPGLATIVADNDDGIYICVCVNDHDDKDDECVLMTGSHERE